MLLLLLLVVMVRMWLLTCLRGVALAGVASHAVLLLLWLLLLRCLLVMLWLVVLLGCRGVLSGLWRGAGSLGAVGVLVVVLMVSCHLARGDASGCGGGV